MTDPFGVLGLPATATLDEVRAARRRLARTLHPDHVGGDAEAMRAVNEAVDAAVRAIRARRTEAEAPPAAPPPPPRHRRAPGGPVAAPPERGRVRLRSSQRDSPSFTIDLLPVEAYEALLVVATWLGEVLVDDPPYVLEAVLDDPGRCWCRLDLVPEAGGSTVSVTVGGIDGGTWPPPTTEQVRDAWVAALNSLS